MRFEQAGEVRGHVAVIGGGFSGTMAAVHLLARGCRVTLIERSGRFAEGLAYGTREPVHLLNVRASNMSAFPDVPDHFACWLEARALGTGASFAPREAYRAYLKGILDDAGASLVRLADEAERLQDGAVRLASGASIEAEAVVVAVGNLPPAPLRAFAAATLPYANDPWSAEGRRALADMARAGGDVLVIGTGLTMVDTVLSLFAQGFGGRVVALSRRGLVPRSHAASAPGPKGVPAQRSPLALLRWVRGQAAQGDWRAVIDSLRPVTAAIWQGWTEAQRGAFIRHLRPWWDVHRHRIAPEVAEQLQRLTDKGRLLVQAGRITGVEDRHVHVRLRGRESERRSFAGIVNCTGPQADIRGSGNPMLRDLLGRGGARTDQLGLGFEVDADLRVLGAPGRVYALGPMTRGTFWESVAVPDIRVQAQLLADTIAADLAEPNRVRQAAQ